MKKKQKLLKRGYKKIEGSIIIFILFAFLSVRCTSSRPELSLPVTNEQKAQKGEVDGAEIYSLDVQISKLKHNGDYAILYTIVGQITPDYWHGHHMLKKIRLTEEDCNYETMGYDKRITLTPVQSYFPGKAGANPPPFRIENRYVIKNNVKDPLKKVLFVSGNKEFLLELAI